MKREKYIYAFDPIINRRVVHLVKNRIAISLVTGHKFKVKKRRRKKR